MDLIVKSRHSRGARPKRWNREEYVRLYELGFFGERKVELIGGVIDIMSPQKNDHVISVERTFDVMRLVYGPAHWVRNQATLNLGKHFMPDPDIAVLKEAMQDVGDKYPTSALLVIEVSDTTLSRDRRKGSMYAAHGIADYWIVNLVDRQVEVYRNPTQDADQPFGFGYGDKHTFNPGATLHPLSAPQANVRVDDLLP